MLCQTIEAPPFDINNPCNTEEAHGIAEARALIGGNVRKGLEEVCRLKEVALAAYAKHNTLMDKFFATHRGLSDEELMAAAAVWPGADEAEAAAEEAGGPYYWAVRYVWKMPVRSVADAIAKAKFALENADLEDDDEDFKGDALQQIADFLAPQELLQAAE